MQAPSPRRLDDGGPFVRLFHRTEVDGMRALAVVAVVLFHAQLKMPGGYVGVDIFFVISGYLITSLLLRDLSAGTFSFRGFWERRVRRIFPALFVMVIGTLAIGSMILLPQHYQRLGRSAVAQALMMANVLFWRDDLSRAGYFGAASEERPLLHTWSLAVEEQFYLFLPLLLFLLFRFRRFRSPRALCGLFIAAAVVGLVVSQWQLSRQPMAAFYLLHSRAWELLCGAAIAALPSAALPHGRRTGEIASWLGLAAMAVPLWCYSKSTPFPGLAALAPCLGAALVIWGNSRAEESPAPTTVGRLLSLGPVVAIGNISYSWYLWHWPVLVMGKYWWPNPWAPPWKFKVALVAVSLVLAVLSWRFVELPFRRKTWFRERKAIFQFAAVATAVSIAAGLTLMVSKGVSGRFPPEVAANATAETDTPDTDGWQLGLDEVKRNQLPKLGEPNGGGRSDLLLWGDSHAIHIIPALDAFCREEGLRAEAATHVGTPPLLDYVPSNEWFGLGESTPEFSDRIIEHVRANGIPNVLLAARWSLYQGEGREKLDQALAETIGVLHSLGAKVWVLQDVPDADADVPRALQHEAVLQAARGRDVASWWSAVPLAYSSAFSVPLPSWRRTVEDHHERNKVLYEAASNPDLPAVFIDPAAALLDGCGTRYRVEINGKSVYHDSNHLTAGASRKIFVPIFRENLAGKLAPLSHL